MLAGPARAADPEEKKPAPDEPKDGKQPHYTLDQMLAPYRERYHISGEINSTVSDVPLKLQELKERYSPEAERVSHGVALADGDPDAQPAIRLTHGARVVAIAEPREDRLKPLVVFPA